MLGCVVGVGVVTSIIGGVGVVISVIGGLGVVSSIIGGVGVVSSTKGGVGKGVERGSKSGFLNYFVISRSIL